ncbi:LPXTG cell wall anchor domain-containing protein [Streptomyces violascens]|uniref:LPXTG cell wall anchor domain-containing protein n=1 Tax=Streptomyces violascens TaxID=67381 RepID=UPI003797CA25
MEKHNVTVPQHRPDRTASRSPRRLAGAAAATGLLLSLAVPALAGTAYADGPGTQPKRPAPAGAAEPGAAPAAPVKRAGESAQPTQPSAARPEAAPPTAQPKGPATPGVQAPGTETPGTAAKPAAPAAAPAASEQKELAHTGSSTANTVMGAGAGALILAGAGTVYAVRRRQQH